MQKKQLLNGMKKATIELILLKLLAEEDMYGYQLTQEVKHRSGGLYTILEGSMYPILYRLTDAKMITSYDQKVGMRKTRVYYHLEPSGKDHLKQLQEDYRDAIKVVDFLLESKDGDVYEF